MNQPQDMPDYRSIAQALAHEYARFPTVAAVAWGGSLRNAVADPGSDIDLYVYTHENLSLDDRRTIATARGEQIEVGNEFWESGDEWNERETGVHIDVMFRSLAWMEDQLARIFVRHEAWIGYTTSFWHNLLVSEGLFDRDGAFGRLQQQARQPYPDGLRTAIIAKNVPLLRSIHGAYLGQIAKAAKRDDIVSVNHRVAVLLASYFDILFALNHQPHPGEKRLLILTQRDCPLRPDRMEQQVRSLLAAAGTDTDAVVTHATTLIDDLEKILDQEHLL